MIWPATPTPLPPGMARFELPSGYSLWDSTDAAIQTWNWLGNAGLVIQLVILVALIITGMFIVYRFFQQFAQKESAE